MLSVPDEMLGERVGAVIVSVPGTALDMTVVFVYLADFEIP